MNVVEGLWPKTTFRHRVSELWHTALNRVMVQFSFRGFCRMVQHWHENININRTEQSTSTQKASDEAAKWPQTEDSVCSAAPGTQKQMNSSSVFWPKPLYSLLTLPVTGVHRLFANAKHSLFWLAKSPRCRRTTNKWHARANAESSGRVVSLWLSLAAVTSAWKVSPIRCC